MQDARLTAALVIGVASLVGCGSSSSASAGPADASADSSMETSLPPRADGGQHPMDASTGCPVAMPTDGTPCSPVPLQCEYGTFDWSDCNYTATCETIGWSVAPPPAGSVCAPNNTACPASASAIVHGAACSTPGIDCFFRETTCYCPQIPAGDAGADAGATWMCDDPGPGCPTPRPFLGAPCSQEGQTCDYASCSLHNIQEQCRNGVWAFLFPQCDAGGD